MLRDEPHPLRVGRAPRRRRHRRRRWRSGADARQGAQLAIATSRRRCCVRRATATTLTVHGAGGRAATQIADDAIEQNIATLRNRVNELGVAEPIIQRQGDDRIVVQLPGVQDTAAGQEHHRRDRDAGIPRRGRRQCLRRRDQRQRAAGRAPLLPPRTRRRRQADADPADQARDRLRRPAGRRAARRSTRRTARRRCRSRSTTSAASACSTSPATTSAS